MRGQEQARLVQNEELHPGVGRTMLLRVGEERHDAILGRSPGGPSGRPRPRAAWPAAPPKQGGPRQPPARGRPCRAAAETSAARSRPELGRRIARGNARARGVPRRGANSAACCRGRHRPMRARPAPSSARYRRRAATGELQFTPRRWSIEYASPTMRRLPVAVAISPVLDSSAGESRAATDSRSAR